MLTSVLSAAAFIQPIKAAGGTIFISADGSIDPLTAPISTSDTITYTFTDDIYDSIIVERNDIIIDGNGYTLQGTGSGTGIDLSGRTNVTVQKTQIKNFESAIKLDFSSNNNINGNKLANNYRGIVLDESSNNSIAGNDVKANNGSGIVLSGSSNYNNISGNNIIANKENGIGLFGPVFVIPPPDGPSNNSIIGNNITGNNREGIRLDFHSNYNSIIGNNVTANDWHGIRLFNSDYNIVSGNDITANSEYGIQIDGSNNSIIGNNIAANNWEGVNLGDSNNDIINNNITANNCGIYASSHNNNISANNITANSEQGIHLSGSSNSISGNNISDNKKGIELYSSSSNSINANNITANNEYGIWLRDASNNIIYHNNFIANFRQVHIIASTSVWDNGFPSGGNYWSDYTGTDSDGDGICNTPYVIDENNTDNHPLMAPICLFDAGTWEHTQYFVNCISNSTVSGFYFDPTEGAFLQFNVEGENGTSGFCRVTIPKDLLHS